MADEQNVDNATQENVDTNNSDAAQANAAPCVYTAEPIIITQPGDNTDMSAITVGPGQTYIFDFDPSVVQSAYQQDGDLIVKFTNNSSITLQDFEGAFSEQFPPALTLADGTIVSATDLISTLTVVENVPAEDELEEPQAEIRTSEVEDETDGNQGEGDAQQVAKIEPAAGDEDIAQKLAQIETAAGDEGGSATNSGFGFGSSFAAGPIDPINAVGPVQPTLLQYGVEFVNDDLFPNEEIPGTPPDDNPILVGPLSHAVDETNLGPLDRTGQIMADFGNDGPGTIEPNGSFLEGGSLLGNNLTSGGVPVIVTPTVDGYVGQAGGVDVFTLVIDPQTGDYTFQLLEPLDHMDASNPNDVITLEFGVVAEDNSGDKAETTITISVVDDAPLDVPPKTETIDEANLGPVAVSDTLTIDFGNDVPGTVEPDGTSNSSGDLAGGVLSSGGVQVIISQTATGYEGKAGGLTVFTLDINSTNGDYTFTLNEPLDHSAPGDTITIDFGVLVKDYDQDSTETTITVNIIDDVPTFVGQPDIGSGVESIDETNLGPINVGGVLNVDFGSDVPGSITPTDNFVEGGSLLGGNLTHNGVAIIVSQTANGYEGFAGGIKVFELTINPNTGAYNFSLLEQLDHNDPDNPNDVITLQFGVQVTDSDGDSANGTITINVADDAVTANDDFNAYNVADGGASGDVITGLNGGPGADDDLSEDVNNTVIEVSFNGNTVVIPDAGSNTINGDFGELEMFSDGTYTYTLFNPVPTGATATSLDPVEADTAGNAASITKNGITVSSFQGNDLSWVDAGPFGTGIGTGGPGQKVFGDSDGLEIDLAQPATSVKITIAEIGANNVNSGIDYLVHLSDGSTVQGEFDIGAVTVVNGMASFTLNGVDFGPGLEITGVDLFSVNNSNLPRASFALHDVEVTHAGPECIHDQFEYVLQDGDFDTDVALLDLKGSFPPVNARIEVNNGVDDVQVKEDGTVDVPLTAGFSGGNGNEHLTLTLDGVDPSWGFVSAGWTPTGNPGQYELVLPVGQQNYVGSFNFTPPAQSDIDLNALSVTATVSGPDAGDNDTVSDGFDITVDAVADDPSIDADNGSINEGQPIAVNVAGMLGVDNVDGSESITGYQISGLPLNGFSFNQGTDQGGGVWTFTAAELVGLTLTPADSNFSGTLDLVAKVFTTENPVSDNEFDLTDNDNMASDPFTLSWRPDIHNPKIEVNNGVHDVCVKEDGTVDVPITAVLGANPAVNEFLTVTVTGIDPSWGTFSAPIGSYNPGTQIWSITLAPGANLNTMFTFTPNSDSDIDLTGMVATAVATDPDTGLSANAMDTFDVIVDAVADAPDLNTNNANGLEGSLISLNVSSSVNDTDGSEVIEAIKISDLPPGATLTAGVENAGVWTLTPAQLVGLQINVPNGTVGSFTLKVEAIAFEQNTNGTEKDLSDNRASAFGEIELNIKPGDDPVLVQPEEVTVDETNLAPTTMVMDTIEANFGNDGPGSYSGNGGFFSAIPLTSDGDTVDVTFDAPTNTYTGKTMVGGETIFTLVIESAGKYTFKLEGVLDHPDATDPNDNIPLEFGITATDDSGDTDDGIITVNVLDDGPVIHNSDTPIDEDSLEFGPIVVSKTLAFDFGEDGAGVITPTGGTIFKAEVGGPNVTIQSMGHDVIVATTATGYTGTANGQPVFTLDVNSLTGEYIYTQFKTIDHSDANDPDDVVWLRFQVKIVDNDGDSKYSWIGIDIHDSAPIANDDMNMFKVTDGGADGNVVTGENGHAGAADKLSQDTPNKITEISFGGNSLAVPMVGTTSIDGDFGTLEISSDGSYNYTLFSIPTTPGQTVENHLDIIPADLDGFQNSITKNGIMISSFLGDDLTWQDFTAQGGGAGISTDGNKVWDGVPGDGLHVDFVQPATSVMFDIGDLQNNLTSGIDYIVYLTDGTSVEGEFDVGTITVVDGIGAFTLDASTFGSVGITGVDLFSVDNSSLGRSSFILSNVWSEHDCVEQTYLDVVPTDLDGFQNTFTKNGITIESFLGDDLEWSDLGALGSGIGTRPVGATHAKVFGAQDGLKVSFDQSADTAAFTIAELGSNNLDDGIDWIAYLSNGSQVQGEFDIGTVTVVGGMASFTIDAADFGTDLTITQVDLFSVQNSNIGTASFLLSNVTAGHKCDDLEPTHDVFEYTLTDFDGDSSSAELALWGKTVDNIIESAQGAEELYGSSSADTFLYDSLADGFDTIKGFDHTEGDILDIAALLSQYDPNDIQQDINDFVFGTEADGNTTISIDENGSGNFANATAIALIEGATGLDLEIITNDGQVVVV